MSSKHTAGHNLGLVYPALLGILGKTEMLQPAVAPHGACTSPEQTRTNLVELLLQMHWVLL
jgi:hypothetical protein